MTASWKSTTKLILLNMDVAIMAAVVQFSVV